MGIQRSDVLWLGKSSFSQENDGSGPNDLYGAGKVIWQNQLSDNYLNPLQYEIWPNHFY